MRCIRDEEEVVGGGGGGDSMEGGIIYLSLHCHSWLLLSELMGSRNDESHFNVISLIVRDKVTRQRPQTTAFWRQRRAEEDSNPGPSAYRPNALPLGQPGSQD